MPRRAALDVAPGFLRQRIPRRAQVGPLGLAALFRHHDGREHGVLDRQVLERAVGVPELVGEHADQLGRTAVGDGAVERHVADVDEFLVLEASGRARGLAQPGVERAKLPRERHLLFLRQRLAAEDKHGVPVHCVVDGADRVGGERLPEVDSVRFGGQQGMQRLECDGHGSGKPGVR